MGYGMSIEREKKREKFIKKMKILLQGIQWCKRAQEKWFPSICRYKVIDLYHRVSPMKYIMVENTTRLMVEIDSKVEDAQWLTQRFFLNDNPLDKKSAICMIPIYFRVKSDRYLL